MLLKSIELQNFRQFINEKIDFSTDKDRNVTLIIGENGTGKTTFAQAFFWCLYGETDFADKTMLNRAIVEQMTPDEIMTVKVILELTHGNASYVITRSQDYKKSYTNKVTGANTVLNIAVKAADGNTRYLKPLECELEIKKILPKELSNYFFFDGERIEKMSKDIASGKKSKAFSEAVVGLTGLNATLSALNHLSPTKPNSVMKKFNENYRDASDGKLQSLTHQIESLQEKMDKATARLSEVEDEIEATSGLKTKLEEEIKQYADGEQLQKDKEKLLRDVKKAQNLKSQFIKEVCKEFNANLTPFLSLSLTKKALETLSHNGLDNKDIPEMHSKTIHYLLKHGTCICGTRLDEGTIPYMKVKELLDYLPPQSIGVTVGQFKKDSRTYYLKPVSLFEEISNKLSLVSEQDETIIDLTENIDLITEKLSGNDVREQVRKISSQIQTCNKTLAERRRERDQLIHNQGGYETEIKQKENDRSELSLIDKNNRQLELYKAYTLRIYEEMLAEYKAKENQIRTKLESYINQIFKFIYDGGLSLTIDERYNVSVYVNEFDGEVETSTAQSISVIFAFISAIIKMARENQIENGDESYSEPYPLVMDAPLSAFDKRRIKAICSAIPETAEQVIIFIKDTDGDLAEENLGTKVMKRHRFEKIDEFHTKLI